LIREIENTDSHGTSLVDRLLESQQQLTAVEKFAQRHTSVTTPQLESHYRDLIPLEGPVEGEQYAFEIDLDACSGCKACVAACHSLNGLDEGELWRNVGLLVGGEEANPVVQHVTSACHHCLDPGCMNGCPVNAYEKDAVTGIVEHLDDQCIGCKYCMFTCPYDVPSYSPSRGIVRKCNMCVDRLRIGEAPACVQACPNQAIKIKKVSQEDIRSEVAAASSTAVVPGAPDSKITLPSTSYLSDRKTEGLLPSDFFVAKLQHAHWPLVLMLTLTQMAAGIFTVVAILQLLGVTSPVATGGNGGVGSEVAVAPVWGAGLYLKLMGMGVLSLGLAVAGLHLGRPLKAYRAMAGIRTSWLSREILAFNLFAGAAGTFVGLSLFPFIADYIGDHTLPVLISSTMFGLVAVFCSATLYVVTGRALWTAGRTNGLFFCTAAVLGLASGLMVLSIFGEATTAVRWTMVALVIIATISKVAFERLLMKDLGADEPTPRRLAAELMVAHQSKQTLVRNILAAIGGIVLPLLIGIFGGAGAAIALPVLMVCCLLAGEIIERYQFFAVSVSRRMPGAPN